MQIEDLAAVCRMRRSILRRHWSHE